MPIYEGDQNKKQGKRREMRNKTPFWEYHWLQVFISLLLKYPGGPFRWEKTVRPNFYIKTSNFTAMAGVRLIPCRTTGRDLCIIDDGRYTAKFPSGKSRYERFLEDTHAQLKNQGGIADGIRPFSKT